jgi:hypothetical protein
VGALAGEGAHGGATFSFLGLEHLAHRLTRWCATRKRMRSVK